MRNRLPEMVKEAHIKALVKEQVAVPRLEEYKALIWSVVRTSSELVIADQGCLFQTSGKKAFVSIAGKNDGLQNIYLPIATDCLVVAGRDAATQEDDVSHLNQQSAALSREYFVASEDSEENQQLQALIGSNSELISEEDITALINEAFIQE